MPGITKTLQRPVCPGGNHLSQALFLIGFDLERSSRPGLGREAAGLLQLALVALDAGRANTEALGHRVNRGSVFLQGINNPLPKMHRVGLHELYYPAGQC